MTKTDLIAKIAEKSDLTKANAERALDAFQETVTEALVQEGKITLTGFGTFEVRKMAARTGRNPRTGEAIAVKATRRVLFSAGKGLKGKVNGS